MEPLDANRLELLPDESVSSWKFRNRGFLGGGAVRMPQGSRDRDFGNLQPTTPAIPESLFTQLQAAARPPDPWLVATVSRQFCPRCLAEAYAIGRPHYIRRAWRIAWHTCCQQHGGFHLESEADQLHGPYAIYRRPLLGLAYPAWSTPGEVIFQGVRVELCGRRAVHLENALSGFKLNAQRSWRPKYLDPLALRSAYALIVRTLVKRLARDVVAPEFLKFDDRRTRVSSGPTSRTWKDLGVFYLLPPWQRFSINVLAESILSVWTMSPLPREAGSDNHTKKLVAAIGWNVGFLEASNGRLSPEALVRRVNEIALRPSRPPRKLCERDTRELTAIMARAALLQKIGGKPMEGAVKAPGQRHKSRENNVERDPRGKDNNSRS